MYLITVCEQTNYCSRRKLASLSVVPDGRSLDSVLRGFAPAFGLVDMSELQLVERVLRIAVDGVTISPLCGLKKIVPNESTKIEVELLPEDARVIKWSKDDAWLSAHLEDLNEWLGVNQISQGTCVICHNQFDRNWSNDFALDSACRTHYDMRHWLYSPHNVWVEPRKYTPDSGENAGKECVEWVAVVKIQGKLYDMRHSYTSGSFISPHNIGDSERFERGCLGGLSDTTMQRIWHERHGEWDEAMAIRRRWE